jgi:hypothetical protein
MSYSKKIKKLFAKSDVTVNDKVDNRIIADSLTALNNSKNTKPLPTEHIFWRKIMKSSIVKLAAAAVIIIAVVIGVGSFLGGTVTFADVIEPILNARTAVLDLVVGSEETGLVVHDIIVGSKIRRTIPNMGPAIVDLDNARMLRLDPLDKSAVYVDIQGPYQHYMNNYLGMVRDIVTDMENHPEWPVQELGHQWIDGQRVVGFLLSEPKIKLTIWADAETAEPIRIEMLTGPSQTIIKNIKFDVPVDESLVSMDIPDGYTLYEGELDYTDFDEQDFIVILQFWAEHVLGGNFPDNMSAEDILKVAPVLRQMIDQLNISDEEKMQIGTAMGRGFMFFRRLEMSGIDWRYVYYKSRAELARLFLCAWKIKMEKAQKFLDYSPYAKRDNNESPKLWDLETAK